MLLGADQDLASHVTTLLGSRLLVFQVNTGSTSLNEQLGQLHDSSQSSVSGISISNDGAEVINEGGNLELLPGHVSSLLPLLSVVEHLSLEQLVHLVGHSVHGVISKIWSRLVGGGGSARALPSTDIDGGEVLGHLDDLDSVKGTEGSREGLLLSQGSEQCPSLLCQHGRSVLGLEGSTKLGDLLSSVWTLDV